MMNNIIFSISIFFTLFVQAQKNFQLEVEQIQKKYSNEIIDENSYVVFTGSSSIRIWKELPTIFNNAQIVNTGFGGSKASDLFYYIKELILDFKPSKVIIYEGDNDIASGHSTNQIITNMKRIIYKIKKSNSEALIIIISAKPSISRWHLRVKYISLNNAFKNLAKSDSYIHFADTWSAMLDNGVLKENIFSSDGLHMNEHGYILWEKVLKPFF
jgi:lysophospholipase L1-like esterase